MIVCGIVEHLNSLSPSLNNKFIVCFCLQFIINIKVYYINWTTMKKLSFKEYYESKQQLLEAITNIPSTINTYVIKKYCKVPVIIENQKEFITFKPKDIIKIIWEYVTPKTPTVKNI